jgi:hypothetical protein
MHHTATEYNLLYGNFTVYLMEDMNINQKPAGAPVAGLVAHYPLHGDCRDHSGHHNHGTNHGVQFSGENAARFNGRDAYIEVANNPALHFGAGDFTLAAWIHTANDLDDVIGDVLDMYDPVARRGITLTINSGSGGYTGPGNDRHVYFGIDNAQSGEWQDCGRPNPASKYVANSLTVYRGKLYAATSGGRDRSDWVHVYRYEGNQEWTDCGRVGDRNTTGVGPLIVHNDQLYAVTSTYDWTRVFDEELAYEPGRVYRYDGDDNWVDCGQPSNNRTLNTAVSYRGQLYVGGGPDTWGVFVESADNTWQAAKVFLKEGGRRCFPHAMTRYHGQLVVGYPVVYFFDGEEWMFAGAPVNREVETLLQTHSLVTYQGRLLAGTWPDGLVAEYAGDEEWRPRGRVGEDGTEVMDLLVYNGQLYGCSIPRAEVCRYEGNGRWTSLRRFYSPPGWTPADPRDVTPEGLKQWMRVTSMTIYDGKLFASTGNCTSSALDSPEIDTIGKVFCFDAGRVASDDNDLGAGWQHIAAIRQGGVLKVYTNGKVAAMSAPFNPADYDVTTNRPLRIGFGQVDYFSGQMADVRIYNRALSDGEVGAIASQGPA